MPFQETTSARGHGDLAVLTWLATLGSMLSAVLERFLRKYKRKVKMKPSDGVASSKVR